MAGRPICFDLGRLTVTGMMNPATSGIFHGILFLLEGKIQIIQTWVVGSHFSENE